MEEEKKISFFKKLIISIKDFEKYPQLASKSWSEAIAYFVKLLTLFVLVVSFTSVYELLGDLKQGFQYIETEMPDFVFTDGKLQVEQEEPIIQQNMDNLFDTVIINTNPIQEETLQEYQEMLQKSHNGVILLQDKMLVKTQVAEQIITYSYSNILQNNQMQEFNKQDLLQYFSGSNLVLITIGIFIMMSLYLFVLYFISTWIDIFLLGAFGLLTALIMRIRLRYSAMCKIAIHSLTLPIILSAIVIIIETFTTFRMKYFEIMYITIAYIYIITAILMIKSDLIKSQKELAKIMQEQAKVREELEKEKEREEEEKEKQKEEKEREEQRKKEKEGKDEEKDKNVGNEPQGENA